MTGPDAEWLMLRDHPIVRTGHLDHYFYEVPEDRVPNPVVASFARGEDVDPAALYAAADEAAEAVRHSESSLYALATLRGRVAEAFPGLDASR